MQFDSLIFQVNIQIEEILILSVLKMEDCGVFYTGGLHPVYEEIPGQREGEYQLLASEYSTLPYTDHLSTILPDTMVSLLPHQHHQHHQYTKPHPSKTNPRPSKPGLPPSSSYIRIQKFGGKAGHPNGSRTAHKPVVGRVDVVPTGPKEAGRGGIRTLDTRLVGDIPANSCDSLTYQTPHTHYVGCNQSDFLPRQAWTDFTGTNEWMARERKERRPPEGAELPGLRSTHRLMDNVSSPIVGSRGRIIASSSGGASPRSSESREISPTCNSLESSDITMSTSSSETYQKSNPSQ